METINDKHRSGGAYAWIADIVFMAAFAGALVFLLWKCKYGFGNIDESFYLTIPYRILQGDGLFVQEWHLSQMTSILLLPFMKMYMIIFGSLEGVILIFRYIYTIIQAAAAVFIYFRLRKYSRAGAGAASLSFMIYAPYGIMAMSYNSLGILNMALALVIMCTAKRAVKIQYIFAGLFYAAAVLCCPYLAIVYVVYLAAVIIAAIRRRKRDIPTDGSVYAAVPWLFVTIGSAIMAVIFLAIVLSRAGIGDIIKAFPAIMADPEHEAIGLISVIKDYIKSILKANAYTLYIFIAFAIVFIIMLIDRKRAKRRLIYFAIAAALTVILMASFMFTFRYLNYTMFPLNAMAVFCAVLFNDSIVRKMFRTIWLPGMIYTFCIHMSSNQQFFVISSASSAALIASCVMTARCAGLMCRKEKAYILTGGAGEAKEDTGTDQEISRAHTAGVLAVIVVICLFAVQLGCETYMRYSSVFWENREDLTVLLEEGPSKGVYSSRANAVVYNDFISAAKVIPEQFKDADSILLLSEKTWGYLALEDLNNSSYSAWLSIAGHVDECLDRQLLYYELNPDKIPDLIYLEPGEEEAAEKTFAVIGDYSPYELDNGATLLVRQQ